MAVHIDREICKGCGLCVHYCPRGVLVMCDELNKRGFAVAEVLSPDKCTKCKMCEIICPDLAIYVDDRTC